jgi:malate synthase
MLSLRSLPIDKDSSMTMHPAQYHVRREDVNVVAADLVNPNVPGKITSGGVHANASAALAYMAAWLAGNGCIPLNHLMEDAATAEIARVQLWQWVKAGARENDTGNLISKEYVSKVIDRVAKALESQKGFWKSEDIPLVARYLKGQIAREWPGEFLTTDLMDELARRDGVDVKWLKSSL